jgi:hypothetical protein
MNPTDLKGPSADLKGPEAGTQKPKSVLLRTWWWKKGSDPEPEKNNFTQSTSKGRGADLKVEN